MPLYIKNIHLASKCPNEHNLVRFAQKLKRFREVLMLPNPDEDRSYLEFLTRMASLYYLEGKTQVEVARALGISRQKVLRLLRQARELGIVEINIKSLTSVSRDLENKLRNIFGLESALVAASYPDEDERRHSLP